MTSTFRELRSAIELLYATFKRYPLRPEIVGCPCCVNERDQAELHESPLSELSSAQLRHYAFKAISTWGDADDFRHFLPRILELVAVDDEFPVDPEIVFGKLVYAGWSHWPADERAAIEAFLRAWWFDFLSEFPPRVSTLNVCETLCSLGSALGDLQPFLDDWLADADLAPRRHLACLLCDNYASLAKHGRLQNAFWGGRSAQRQQIERWIGNSDLRGALDFTAQSISDAAILDEILQAIDYLDWLRA